MLITFALVKKDILFLKRLILDRKKMDMHVNVPLNAIEIAFGSKLKLW